MSRLDADQCILEHHAPFRRYAETTSRFQKDLGIRFTVRDIFGGDDNLKAISKADRRQTGFDIKAMGRRDGRTWDFSLLQLVQPRHYSRQRFKAPFQNDFTVKSL